MVDARDVSRAKLVDYRLEICRNRMNQYRVR